MMVNDKDKKCGKYIDYYKTMVQWDVVRGLQSSRWTRRVGTIRLAVPIESARRLYFIGTKVWTVFPSPSCYLRRPSGSFATLLNGCLSVFTFVNCPLVVSRFTWRPILGLWVCERLSTGPFQCPLPVFEAMMNLRSFEEGVAPGLFPARPCNPQLHPVVLPQVTHFRQVPLRTRVKLPQESQASPS